MVFCNYFTAVVCALVSIVVGGCRAAEIQTFTVTDVAYLDVEVAGTELGTIEIGLFGEIAPKTVANFVTILTKGINGRTYAGTKFHRVFNKFVIQGPDTNGCQFFITTRSTPSLNGEHVLFGIVVEGQEVIHVVEQQLTDHLGRPTKEIRITKCGLLNRRPPFEVTDHPRNSNVWKWIIASALPVSMSTAILLLFQWMISQINKAII
ncbi:peptidyl-prolyl cis-trans isomerase, rhodopsin-specific isozyme-like isoform X2 [Rhopalosiphum maidis]|uniref:peptidyl-prolyl cis-trans isomerase, rhodopsin-specific isozyme-like isoform X2 n=1 Tax=Rhopalosiphum maidis TaxID=43146 RepID=UPI000EFE80ED|nr:peptidyl-prolyl cis-trans isomerase, rhodopsin-specific isozyme-like isoform X2 [Rhopalosiphum maidis]